jgi:hypothetical protein
MNSQQFPFEVSKWLCEATPFVWALLITILVGLILAGIFSFCKEKRQPKGRLYKTCE